MTDTNLNIHMLVVEDDASTAKYLMSLFQRYSGSIPITYEFVGSIRAAEERLSDQSLQAIDVTVLDLMLPNGSGLVSLMRVVAAAARIPVVVLTGDDSDQTEIDVISHGAQDHMRKRGLTIATIGSFVTMCYHAIIRHRSDQKWARLQQCLEEVKTTTAEIVATKK